MKDIPGLEGRYACTEDRKIWSYISRKFIKQSTDRGGYSTVILSNNLFDRKNYSVHRLMALTYLPNPDNKPCINHINGIRSDNRLENLEWCTYSENSLHAFRILGKKKINMKKVGRYNKDGTFIDCFESNARAALELRLNEKHIGNCARGEQHRKTHGGFIWKYL